MPELNAHELFPAPYVDDRGWMPTRDPRALELIATFIERQAPPIEIAVEHDMTIEQMFLVARMFQELGRVWLADALYAVSHEEVNIFDAPSIRLEGHGTPIHEPNLLARQPTGA